MKLKLRILDDSEERDLRERAEARSDAQAQKASWQAGAYSLHQEFSRISFGGQPVFHLRVQGPEADALNGELAGLEFFACQNWYHPASETVAVARHTGRSALPAISLIDLKTHRVKDIASEQHIVWRSLASGTILLTNDGEFCTMDNDGRQRPLVSAHRRGYMIEDMLVAFNEGQPRVEMTLADPVLQRREDYLGPELMGTQLDVDFSRDFTIRLLHRNDLELCFDLLRWKAGRCVSVRKFAVGISSIALGTIDD